MNEGTLLLIFTLLLTATEPSLKEVRHSGGARCLEAIQEGSTPTKFAVLLPGLYGFPEKSWESFGKRFLSTHPEYALTMVEYLDHGSHSNPEKYVHLGVNIHVGTVESVIRDVRKKAQELLASYTTSSVTEPSSPNITLIGFSFGGLLALEYMRIHRGAGVEKLILIAPLVRPVMPKIRGYTIPYGACESITKMLCSIGRENALPPALLVPRKEVETLIEVEPQEHVKQCMKKHRDKITCNATNGFLRSLFVHMDLLQQGDWLINVPVLYIYNGGDTMVDSVASTIFLAGKCSSTYACYECGSVDNTEDSHHVSGTQAAKIQEKVCEFLRSPETKEEEDSFVDIRLP